YVEIANTSHNNGEVKFIHKGPLVFGYGNTKNASHTRPMCQIGNWPAQITAKIVIASAARFTPVLQPWRNNNKIAEINVPAWPIPIHHTKLVISQPQPTVRFTPHVPRPQYTDQVTENMPK